ncbi:MAG: cytochrome c [Capsulimonadales bacterium]|nr:cytochrome c [Capsulimonadales bacterium]
MSHSILRSPGATVIPSPLSLLSLLSLLFLAVLAGCSSEPGKENVSASGSATSAVTDAGKAAFDTNCARCHSLGEGRRSGPDLAHAGADPRHTAQWFAEFIKDPKSKDPGSTMPAFAHLPPATIDAISAFLVTRK